MTLISPHDGQPITSAQIHRVADVEDKAVTKKRDLAPAPGYVILLRDKQSEYVKNRDTGLIEKNPLYDRNKYAEVARVGPNREDSSIKAWFAPGDTVWINESLLEEVDLGGGSIVEIAPFSAVKGKFVDVEE